MEGVCRLCCSGAGVTHEIFDDSRSTYLKLSTCLPVKVFKDDQLPQKICVRCNGRLDEFYQFCSEAIASQARLRESISVYAPDKMIPDFESIEDLSLHVKQSDESNDFRIALQPVKKPVAVEAKCTQTEDFVDTKINVKREKSPVQIKSEPVKVAEDVPLYSVEEDLEADYVPSDYSDDISLKLLKKKKKKHRKEKIKIEKVNGEVKKTKKRRRKELGDEFDNGSLAINENGLPESHDVQLVKSQDVGKNFEPGISLEAANGIQIKQEWMNMTFESGLLDAVASQYLDPSMIKSEVLTEEEPWYCCICFVKCSNKNDMITHYRSHVSPEDLKLEPECKLDITEDEEKEEEKNYKCKVCNKVFNRKYTLEKHALVHEDRSKRPYRCSLCEKTFREVNQILKHGRTHSYEAPETTPVAECVVPDCPTALKGELCPDRHLVVRPRTHPQPLSKRFVCDLCDEGFVYMRYLIEHRNRTHPEASERKFVNRCMHCGREFAHLNSLRRHLRSHTGERNFLCNVCGKALSSREHLKFHIRIHTGYKPNVCKTCGKGFVKKCNLTLHERVHSGEKPHVCSHCGKAFSQRSTLVIHERYHSGARPYVCTLCGKGFVAKGLLSMHLKTTCI